MNACVFETNGYVNNIAKGAQRITALPYIPLMP